MREKCLRAIASGVIITLIIALAAATTYGQIRRQISYQGMLTDVNGQTIADGQYNLVFRLYDDVSAGRLLWEEAQTIEVRQGLFSTYLGSVVSLAAVDFHTTQIFLETGLSGQRPFPRTRMAVVPYAVRAESADRATSVDTTSLNVVRSVNGVRGNLLFVGVNGISITQRGDTLQLASTVVFSAITEIASPENTLTIGNARGPSTTLDVRDGAITTSKLAPGSVTGTITADSAIATRHIANASVTSIKLAPGVIPTTLPPSGAAGGDLAGTYPNPSLAPASVTSIKLQDGAVGTSKILDLAVTTDKLSATGVSPGVYGDDTSFPRLTVDAKGRITNITTSPLFVAAGGDLIGVYPNPMIRINAVTTSKIFDLAVTSAKLADGSVTNPKIAVGAVNSFSVRDSSLSTLDLAPGTIPSSLPPLGPAGGDLAGIYPNPLLATTAAAGSRIVDALRADFIAGDADINAPNNIVMRDASGRLPAADGSLLTNLNAGAITSGVLGVANGGTSSSTPLQNNRIMVSSGGRIVESTALAQSQLIVGTSSGTLQVRLLNLDDLSDAKIAGTGFTNSLIIGQEPPIGTPLNVTNQTAVGVGALRSANDGDDNTAIGQSALANMANGNANTAIGTKAMEFYETLPDPINFGYNVAVGDLAAQFLQSGTRNTFVGSAAGQAIYRAVGLVGIGQGALSSNGNSTAPSEYNIGIGVSAMRRNINSTSNIGVGTQTMSDVSGLADNVIVGHFSAPALTNSTGNAALGNRTFVKLLRGNRNVAVGDRAGELLTDGDGNILIGSQSGGASSTYSNKLYIDNSNTDAPLIKGDFASNSLEFNGDVTVRSSLTVDGITTLGNDVSDILIVRASSVQMSGIPTTGLSTGVVRRSATGGLEVSNALFVTSLGTLDPRATLRTTTDGQIQSVLLDSAQVLVGVANSVPQARRLELDDLTDAMTKKEGYNESMFLGSIPDNPTGRIWGVTALGYRALSRISYGSSFRDFHTAVGWNALSMLENGWRNTAVGAGAGQELIEGNDNSFFGVYSGSNIAGRALGLTGIGSSTLSYNPDPSESYFNTAIGSGAMRVFGMSNLNVAVGANTMASSWQNQSNIMVGNEVANEMRNSEGNVALGDQAIRYFETGDKNIVIGFMAGKNLWTGSGNIFIGPSSGGTATDQSNQLYIDNSETDKPLIKGDFDKRTLVINGSTSHGGGLSYPIKRVDQAWSTIEVGPSDHTVIAEYGTTVVLPAPISCTGRVYVIVASLGNVEVQDDRGRVRRLGLAREGVTLQSDGLQWWTTSEVRGTSATVRLSYDPPYNEVTLDDNVLIMNRYTRWIFPKLPDPRTIAGREYTFRTEDVYADLRWVLEFDPFHIILYGEYGLLDRANTNGTLSEVTIISDGYEWRLKSFSIIPH